MVHALQSELFRLRRRPQSWVMLTLAGLFIALFYTTAYLLYTFDELARTDAIELIQVDAVMSYGMQLFGFFGFLLTVIVASGLIGAEYGWNTLRPLVARTRTRSALLSAKWITVVLYTALIVVAGVVSAIISSLVGSVLLDADVSISSEFLGYLLGGTLRWFVATLPYAVIAFAVALLTRSNAAGIAIGIGLGFVEPLVFQLLGLLSSFVQDLQKWGIIWNVQRIVSFDDNAVTTGDLWRSAAILAVYCAVAVLATYMVFTRRDITSG